MPTFSSGFIRPGVYVKQTAGQGAPQLPPSFVAALIGQGADRFTVSSKEIVSSASSADVLDDARNVASIISVKVNNVDVTTGFSVANAGSLPFGTASIAWSAGKPAAGRSYFVTYVAYKNPSVDYAVALYNDDMAGQLNYHGAPAQSANEVINGVYVKNNISLGAAIVSGNGATSWYSAQLNPYDTSTFEASASYGTITGATGSTGTAMSIQLNGDGAQSVTLVGGQTGATLAAAVQTAVRALTAANPALQAAYDLFTCVYTGGLFNLTSGMVGAGTIASSGAISAGSAAAGTGATILDLTDEAGLYTATEQVLAKLELVDSWCVIPLFPAIIGGLNASIVPLLKAHVNDMRAITTQKFRVAIVGGTKNTDNGTNPETKYITTAGSLGTNALGIVAPATAKYIYGGVTYTLDGWSIAAAAAGIMTNPVYGAGEPISGKELVGFSEIKDVFNTTQKNLLGTAGVLMIDNELSVPAIIMDLTTDQSNAVNSQFKFTRAADYVSKSLRIILRKLYINVNNLGDTTMSNIGSTVKMILQQMVWLHIINDFADPKVSKNQSDARQVDLVVAIQLVPDVSWIYVNLGVNL